MPKTVGRSKRQKIFERDGYQCWYCGCKVFFYYEQGAKCVGHLASVDHVESLIRGGDNNLKNLVTSCRSCNSVKGPRSLEQFRTYLASRTKEAKIIKHLNRIVELAGPTSDPSFVSLIQRIAETVESQKPKIYFYGESGDPSDWNGVDDCVTWNEITKEQGVFKYVTGVN